MIPDRYFYLVDETTEDLLAIFPVGEEYQHELKIITLEAQLRAEHNVDDPLSGLALRDSLSRPLDPELLRLALSMGKRVRPPR